MSEKYFTVYFLDCTIRKLSEKYKEVYFLDPTIQKWSLLISHHHFQIYLNNSTYYTTKANIWIAHFKIFLNLRDNCRNTLGCSYKVSFDSKVNVAVWTELICDIWPSLNKYTGYTCLAKISSVHQISWKWDHLFIHRFIV